MSRQQLLTSRLEGRTVWLSQRLIAERFQVSVKTANAHLVNIYSERELGPEATIRSFRILQTEGSRQVSRAIDHYSRDAILAVGYRVRSACVTAHGAIRKADVATAKNYLSQPEITELNRAVTLHLDSAEDQARRNKTMHMAQWGQRLDAFLQFNERDVLTHAGTVSHQLAEAHAHGPFKRRDADRRRLEAAQPSSDFDRAVDEVKRLGASAAPAELSGAKKPAMKAVRKPRLKGMRDE